MAKKKRINKNKSANNFFENKKEKQTQLCFCKASNFVKDTKNKKKLPRKKNNFSHFKTRKWHLKKQKN